MSPVRVVEIPIPMIAKSPLGMISSLVAFDNGSFYGRSPGVASAVGSERTPRDMGFAIITSRD